MQLGLMDMYTNSYSKSLKILRFSWWIVLSVFWIPLILSVSGFLPIRHSIDWYWILIQLIPLIMPLMWFILALIIVLVKRKYYNYKQKETIIIKLLLVWVSYFLAYIADQWMR